MNTKIKNAGFHHIAVKATNYDKSYEFYTNGLGLVPVASWGEGESRGVMMNLGDGGCIELFAGGVAVEKVGTEVTEGYENLAGNWMHFAIKTDDAQGAFDAAIQAGAVCQKEPFEVTIPSTPPMPVKIAFVTGPDGEVIEFFELK
ncbi:MAG: VOC family protein [Clostridia bacterium]